MTLRKYVVLCGPHSLTHCPFQLSSNRTMAAIQVLYLISAIFQTLIAPKGSQEARDWDKMVAGGQRRTGHTSMHTHGAHAGVSDAFHFPPHTTAILNTMSMYLTIILFLFPLTFTCTLGAFFSAKKWDCILSQNKPSQSGPVVGTSQIPSSLSQ